MISEPTKVYVEFSRWFWIKVFIKACGKVMFYFIKEKVFRIKPGKKLW